MRSTSSGYGTGKSPGESAGIGKGPGQHAGGIDTEL